jgi:hypothetical protein
MLQRQPELAGATIETAAAVGDVAAAQRFLSEDPDCANRIGGPFGWEPLLYLTYSRIDSDDPAHDPVAVARLLLDAGADPNDSQALYNRQFDPAPSHLELLIEFGLGTDRGGPWHARLNSAHGTPAQLLEDQLIAAAFEDRPEWARLALAAGADPDGLGTRHPLRYGLTPYEAAVRRGNREVAELLAAGGATVPALDPVEELLAACMAADRGSVERMLADRPVLKADAITRRPDAVLQATELRRPDAIRLLAELGFDVNVWGRITPLHQAAYDGDVVVVQTLLDVGADPELRDPGFNATPLGWAEHARRDEVIALLRAKK